MLLVQALFWVPIFTFWFVERDPKDIYAKSDQGKIMLELSATREALWRGR